VGSRRQGSEALRVRGIGFVLAIGSTPKSRPSLRYFDILKPMIRLLATDLDGTFWGPDFVPPSDHVAAVHALERQDVTVLAATSRRPKPTKQRLGDHGLVLPAILVDGAVGIDFRTGERFHEAVFGAEAAHDTLAVFQGYGAINADTFQCGMDSTRFKAF